MNTRKFFIPKNLLILLSLAILLNLLRVVFYHSTYFVYLLWNIFLALLPLLVSSLLLWLAYEKKLTKEVAIIGGIVWLLLLPNAPYLVTDLIHLGKTKSAPIIYDTFLIFSSAWVGLLMGLHSIWEMETIIKLKFSLKVTRIFIVIIIFLTSFGMYLGRFLRFNSWHVLSMPGAFFHEIWSIFSQPANYVDAYLFTILSFIFLYFSYNAWKSGR